MVLTHLLCDLVELRRPWCLLWLDRRLQLGPYLKKTRNEIKHLKQAWAHQILAPTSEGLQNDKRFMGPVSVTSTMTGSSVAFVKGIAMEVLESIGDEMLTAFILSGLRPHPDKTTHHSCSWKRRLMNTGRKWPTGVKAKMKKKRAKNRRGKTIWPRKK